MMFIHTILSLFIFILTIASIDNNKNEAVTQGSEHCGEERAEVREAELGLQLPALLHLHGSLLHAHPPLLRVLYLSRSHTFCYECISSCIAVKPNCPICRTEVQPVNVGKDLLAYSIINELEVFCVYDECSWKVVLVPLRASTSCWSRI